MTATVPTRAHATASSRHARTATVGAVLWTSSALVWGIAELSDQRFGTLEFIAVAAAWWIFLVVPPALLVPGHAALRQALGPGVGRAGITGIVLSAAGLAAMGVGIGIEVASMSVGGGEVPLGHAILLIGWLVAVLGALITGVTVLRRRRDGASRAGGVLLVLAVPLGVGIGALGAAVAPHTDAFFWAALTVPIGLAWVLLGRSLATDDGAGR